MMWLRHLLSIAILPFTVAVVIPLSIASRYHVRLSQDDDALRLAIKLAGAVLLGIGLAFFVASVRRFAQEGHGTLAPWDPPVELVVRGPYRYVRNPMISGVVIVLFGESLVLLSPSHAAWAVTFLVINLVYIPLFEEPQLASRFGEAYLDYCRHVPRILPRSRPWVQRP